MKKKTVVRSVLIVSLISVLCLILCVGPTFALLVDRVVNNNNVIKSGVLEIDLQIKNNEGNYESVRQNDIPIINYDKWEPGYTQVVNARVVNKGNLSLSYELQVVATGILEALMNNTPLLSDVIDVYYSSSEVIMSTRAELDDAIATAKLTHVGTLTQLLLGGTLIKDYLLPAGADPAHGESEHYSTIVLIMKSEVGLEYQGLTVGDETFRFDLTAKQYSYENDSFDNKYDLSVPKGAIFDGGITYEVNESIILNENSIFTDAVTAVGEGTVVNIRGGYYDAASKDCAVWAKDGATVNIYGGTFFCDGLGVDAVPSNHQDLIYAGANGGKINIYGGLFISRDSGTWLLNEKDGQGTITVYGGTFVDWDPSDNISEGEHTNYLAAGSSMLMIEKGDSKYYSVTPSSSSLALNKEGGLDLSGGHLTLIDVPLNHDINRTSDFILEGNGTTVDLQVLPGYNFFPEGEDALEAQGGGFFSASCTIFTSINGSKNTVNDITFAGTIHTISLGDYRAAARSTAITEFNNVNVIDIYTLVYGKWCTALSICGKAYLNNCNVYGTQRSPLDPYASDGKDVYDIVFCNLSKTYINGGVYGMVYADNSALIQVTEATFDTIRTEAYGSGGYFRLGTNSYAKNVTASNARSNIQIVDNAKVDVLDLTKMTRSTSITIEPTATVGKIVDGTHEFSTLNEWKASRGF